MPSIFRVRLFMTDLQTTDQAAALRQALSRLPGLSRIDIVPAFRTAVVVGTGLDPLDLMRAVAEAGLTLISTTRLPITGIRAPLYRRVPHML